jgi:hypothetical protein
MSNRGSFEGKMIKPDLRASFENIRFIRLVMEGIVPF